MKRTLILAGAMLMLAQQVSAQDTLRLTAGEAARLAARNNAAVIGARYRVEEARARVAMQRSALLPQISASASQTGHTLNTATFGLDFPSPPGEPPLFDPNGEVIGPIELSDVRGRLSQTLFDWSALERLRSTRAAYTAAAAQEQAAEETAARAAANAYVQALRAQEVYASRQADIALAHDLVRIAEEQLASGTGVRLDVTRARAQEAALNAQLVAARNAAERANLALARALGVPSGTRLAITDTLPGMPAAPDAEAAISAAMARRAELRAVEAQIHASEMQASALRSERLPKLSFVGDDGFIGNGWDHLLHTYDWGLQVSVPLFTGLRTRAQVQEQRAQTGELEARRRDLREQVEFEVRSALLDLTAGAELVDAAGARLRLAEQEVSDARVRFESGVAGSGDVVTASLRLTEARTAYTDALVQYQTARVALAAAQGIVTELP